MDVNCEKKVRDARNQYILIYKTAESFFACLWVAEEEKLW